jgi:hypothetical protein
MRITAEQLDEMTLEETRALRAAGMKHLKAEGEEEWAKVKVQAMAAARSGRF